MKRNNEGRGVTRGNVEAVMARHIHNPSRNLSIQASRKERGKPEGVQVPFEFICYPREDTAGSE